MQICSYASDSIMTDGVAKLQDINEGMRERDLVRRLSMQGASPQQRNKNRSNSLVVGSRESLKNTYSKFQTIAEESSSSEELSQ